MKINVLKSNEIDLKLWRIITNGFNEAFDKNKTTNNFIEYYKNTILDYSYHALAFSETGDLCGSTTIIPHYYNVNNNKYIFGVSGGTFVRKKYRNDIFVYKDMMDSLKTYCKNEGLKVIYGVPNKNSLKYTTDFLKFKYILNLDYYVVPLRIGNILKLPFKVPLNYISYFTFSSLINLGEFISNFKRGLSKPNVVHIEFNQNFINKRFKYGYEVIKKDNFFVAYKISLEDNIRTAFLMEYRDNGVKSYKSFIKAINIIKKTGKVDIIIYIGIINHFRFSTLKLPKNKQPQNLSLTIKSLDKDKKFNTFINDKNNWDFSLVNYDVR